MAAAFFVIRFFIVAPGRVNGPSMEPTLRDENLFFVSKLAYAFSEPTRGDIIQIVDIQNNRLIIKRIIGLPGETITIRRGQVFVGPDEDHQEALEEPYLAPYTFTKVLGTADRVVPVYRLNQNQYFVLGDNRGESIDSRYLGPIYRPFIVGKILGQDTK